ncbi:hypothetical protein EVG20_g10903 [Dentipellis fragilis]|uniref:Uncharacterized protein n=1 Tax=Dentipellis fragilis TaxID=205917 RepID=A0A4Y9XNI0_9AGAM|nr:hypothetical protein EVG20_g10903 [Dentipellis fragilis]
MNSLMCSLLPDNHLNIIRSSVDTNVSASGMIPILTWTDDRGLLPGGPVSRRAWLPAVRLSSAPRAYFSGFPDEDKGSKKRCIGQPLDPCSRTSGTALLPFPHLREGTVPTTSAASGAFPTTTDASGTFTTDPFASSPASVTGAAASGSVAVSASGATAFTTTITGADGTPTVMIMPVVTVTATPTATAAPGAATVGVFPPPVPEAAVPNRKYTRRTSPQLFGRVGECPEATPDI